MQNAKQLFFFYLDQIWRRRWLALSFAWGICLVGWMVVALMPDHYTSEARVYVDTLSLLNPLLKGISVNSEENNRDQEVAIMQRTLTSRPNLAKVVQMTDMDKSVKSEADLQELLDTLDQRISIRMEGNNLFAVDYSDNSAITAKNVVQALLTIFVESSVGNKREDIQTARSFIESQIDDYEKQLRDSEEKLADFKVKHLEYFSAGSENFASRMEQAKDNVNKIRLEASELAAQRIQMQAQLDKTPQFLSMDASPQVVMGEGGTLLQQRIKAMQTRLDEMKMQYTDKHPEVVRTQAALKDLLDQQAKIDATPVGGTPAPGVASRPQSQISNEVYNQLAVKLAEIDSKVTSAKNRLEAAESEVADLEKKAADAPRIEAEFTGLNRDYSVIKGNFDSLLQRRKSARIAQAANSSTEPVQFRVVAAPEVPAMPTGPKRRLFNVLVFLFGAAGGCGIVILLVEIEDNVSKPEDLAVFADRQILGYISIVRTQEHIAVPFYKRHAKFGYSLGGLATLFVCFTLISPNLSALTHKFFAMVSS